MLAGLVLVVEGVCRCRGHLSLSGALSMPIDAGHHWSRCSLSTVSLMLTDAGLHWRCSSQALCCRCDYRWGCGTPHHFSSLPLVLAGSRPCQFSSLPVLVLATRPRRFSSLLLLVLCRFRYCCTRFIHLRRLHRHSLQTPPPPRLHHLPHCW